MAGGIWSRLMRGGNVKHSERERKMESESLKNKSVLRDVYPLITSFEWLENAYRNARKQKRYRNEVLAFSNNLDQNLLTIQQQMRSQTFTFGPYRRHWVSVPKKRLVMALPFDSRIVQWSIYLILNPFYDKLMIEDSFACRKGKGSLAAILRLQYWLRLIQNKPHDWYCLKLDISKYFYRVDHGILLDILSDRVKDKDLLTLLDTIINCNGERFGLPRFMSPMDAQEYDWLDGVGMPIGNLTSQLFANIYLNELDQFCKHTLKIPYYVRYMDDIIIIAQSKELAHFYKREVGRFLSASLHLDLNSKTVIRPAQLPIEFVGYTATAGCLKLRKQTIRRMKSAFRAICRNYFEGRISQAEFDRRVASYGGMIAHVRNEQIKARMNEIYIHAKEVSHGRNSRTALSGYPDAGRGYQKAVSRLGAIQGG